MKNNNNLRLNIQCYKNFEFKYSLKINVIIYSGICFLLNLENLMGICLKNLKMLAV